MMMPKMEERTHFIHGSAFKCDLLANTIYHKFQPMFKPNKLHRIIYTITKEATQIYGYFDFRKWNKQ